MKNLVMGVATGYDWYTLEPFVTSFKRYCKNAELVLFVDNISEFTRANLQKEGVKLQPVPDQLKPALIIDVRWTMYKNFLDERGKDYRQVFLTDTRDVIFQGDLFEKYSAQKNFLVYATEGESLKNSINETNYKWVKNLFGQETADKLANREIICAGTVLGTVDEIKILCSKMIEELKRSTAWGDEQAAFNYLIYENRLDIKNIVKSDCQSGNIFCVTFFHLTKPIKIDNDKILHIDGSSPAAVHEYPCFQQFIQLVDKLYRDKKFLIDENFSDTRSMLEQTFYLAKVGRIDDAYKLFTKHLFGKKLSGFGNMLIKIWESALIQNPSAELLALSIQNALPSAFDKSLSLEQINKICSLINFSMKTRKVIGFNFKIFMANVMYRLANDFYNANRLEKCLESMEFISTLEITLNKDFYLFKAKIYRESGRKSDALAAYEKALDT